MRGDTLAMDRADASTGRWQTALADAIREPRELAALLGLEDELWSTAAASDFPLLVPRGYVARMQPGDPNDPLLYKCCRSCRKPRRSPQAGARSSWRAGLQHRIGFIAKVPKPRFADYDPGLRGALSVLLSPQLSVPGGCSAW